MNPGAPDRSIGKLVLATSVTTSGPGQRRAVNIVLLVAASLALVMTGYGIIMPVFARRLSEFGAGPEALGSMTMGFAAAQFLLGPFMGSFADRFGRRPLVLVALVGFAIANVAFLSASSPLAYTGIRVFEGAITAGLFPAAMGIVADIIPSHKRARWVGIVMGSYGAGFIFGPVIGGVLYDNWGFVAPFAASAGMATLAFVFAAVMIPETRTASARRRARMQAESAPKKESIVASLPRPLHIFATLLLLDFFGVFAFAFVEPAMVFYVYDHLKFTTAQFGVVVGVYGLAMVSGQALLGRLSDRFGRKPVIGLGFLLNTAFYFGLTVMTDLPMVFAIALVGGIGSALVAPALGAFYLDIAKEQHGSRIVGMKESASALGGIVGPLLVALIGGWIAPQGIFAISGVLMVLLVPLALIVLKERRGASAESPRAEWLYAGERAPTALASLRGIVAAAKAHRALTSQVHEV